MQHTHTQQKETTQHNITTHHQNANKQTKQQTTKTKGKKEEEKALPLAQALHWLAVLLPTPNPALVTLHPPTHSLWVIVGG